MILLHLLLAFAAPQGPEVPPDTAQALERASLLIFRHYESLNPNNRDIIPCRRGEGDGACLSERVHPWDPTSTVPWRSACRGPGFAECFAGDWDCAGPVRGDCLEPHRRAALIDRLEELAHDAGDAIWLFQQRVGMAVKQGDLQRAHQVAQECGTMDWFCPALRGFVEHRIRPGDGLAALDSAVALAPERVRCFWMDPAPLWAGGPTDECPEDLDEWRLVWWLSDPLWTRGSNMRRAEHLARHVIERITWGARTGRYQRLWENVEDRSAAALQYTPRSRMLSQGPYNSLDHSQTQMRAVWIPHTYGGHSFAPSRATVRAPLESTPADWQVEWDEGEERMFITENWYNLDHQAVVLRRGDRLRVVTAAEVPPELDASSEAGLAVGRLDDLEIFTVPGPRDPDGNVRAEIVVDDGDYLGSVEVVAPNGMARAREGLPIAPLRDGFGVSQPALLRGGPEAEGRELLEVLLPTTALHLDTQIELYFEIYGADDGEMLALRLEVEQEGGSLWSRVASIFRGSDPPVELEWEEPVSPEAGPEGPLVRRRLDVDLTGLSVGEHRLVVEVRRADGETVEAARRFGIVE